MKALPKATPDPSPKTNIERHATKRMRLSDLTPAPYNPRAISKDALAGLAESLKEFGLLDGIAYNKRTGHIIGGHQRIKALIASGETEADVKVVDWPLEKEKAANVTLNNQEAQGQFTDALTSIVDELKAANPLQARKLLLDKLVGEGPEASLSARAIARPPAMTWALIGIPTVHYGQIAGLVEQVKDIPQAQVHVTIADGQS